jgi:hypothetical protein
VLPAWSRRRCSLRRHLTNLRTLMTIAAPENCSMKWRKQPRTKWKREVLRARGLRLTLPASRTSTRDCSHTARSTWPGTCSNRDWRREVTAARETRRQNSERLPFDRDVVVPLRAAPLPAPATIFANDAAVLFEQAKMSREEVRRKPDKGVGL